MQDYVGPRPLAVRTCSASGTKFHDANANGRRDAGEPGLPRWMIWADYDDDGVRDANEPYALTDNEGQYVINDIRPPDGTYVLRETLSSKKARSRAKAASWICSYPNDGTLRRHRLGAGRPVPVRLGADQHGDGDRRARTGLR